MSPAAKPKAGDDVPAFTTEEKIGEIVREIEMRRRVFPGQIAAGKMSAPTAKKRIDILRAIERDYRERQQ